MNKGLEKSGVSQAREKFTSFCKEKRTLFFCVFLSIVSHTPCLTTENQIQTVSELLGQTHVMRERIEMFFKQSFRGDSRAEYLEQLKGQPADKVKLGNFFLKTEFNEGITDDDEVQEGQEKLKQMTQSFKTLAATERDQLKVLHELVKQQGTHEEGESSLNSILVDGKGNCEARAKLAISVLQETYPNMPVKLQHMLLNSVHHIRAIAQVEGKWYALEGSAPKPVEKKDFQGTIVTDASAFVSSYTGRNFGVNRIGLKNNPKRRKVRITNTYFNLLSGADRSQLVDFADTRTSKPKKPKKPKKMLTDPKKAQAEIRLPKFTKPTGKSLDKEDKEDKEDKKGKKLIRIKVLTKKEANKLFNKSRKNKRKQKPFEWTDEIIASAAQEKSFKNRHTVLDDLSPLEGLPIKDVDLEGTNVSSLLPLKEMSIQHINLNDTKVTDLTPLQGMPLKAVWLSDTSVTDVSPLKGMPIKTIDLTGTEISDLTPLESAPLGRIDLDSTNVIDLGPLRGAPIRFIDLSNTEVVDLSPLEGMYMIERIFLSNTNVSDLSPLKGMSVKKISLSGSNIFDLSPLKGMPIESIDLSHTDVSDLSPLRGMNITSINLSHTNVTDLSPLAGMPLRHIDISNTEVSDIGPVLGGRVISSLNIKNTKVKDLVLLEGKRVYKFYNDFSPQTRWPFYKDRNRGSRSRRPVLKGAPPGGGY